MIGLSSRTTGVVFRQFEDRAVYDLDLIACSGIDLLDMVKRIVDSIIEASYNAGNPENHLEGD